MEDPVIDQAIKLRDRLLDVAKELRIAARSAKTDAGRQCADMDAKTCDDAAAMLQKLGTEVTRLRQGIGCFHYGRIDRFALRRMSENWNDDAPARSGPQ